jgi:hypothetical protein
MTFSSEVYTGDEVGIVECDMSLPCGRCAARCMRFQGLLDHISTR